MKKNRSYNNFKKYAVSAVSLEDFLERYTKPKAHKERGAGYVAARIQSHQEHIDKYGFTFITHHDSKCGETVSYYPTDGGSKP